MSETSFAHAPVGLQVFRVTLDLVLFVKTIEIWFDMAWTIRTGPAFAEAGHRLLVTDNGFDIGSLEAKYNRPQPIYRFLRTVAARGHPFASALLTRFYWTPLLLTLAAVPSALAVHSRDSLEVTVHLIAVWVLTLSTLANAPLRRFRLGAIDQYNRDLLADRGAGLSDVEPLGTERAGSALAGYFLWLTWCSIIGYASIYSCIESLSPLSFGHSLYGTGFDAWLYFSITALSTEGFGDIHPYDAVGHLAVSAQVLSGPLLLSFLVAVFFSGSPRR